MLKGIEAQLMVTRTADLAREAGAMQRKNDLVRDYLAQQTQALAEIEKQQVAQALKAQAVVIHRDKQGGGRQEYAEQEGEQREFAEEEEYTVPSSGNHTTIDIKV
jgi:hypothetical protein